MRDFPVEKLKLLPGRLFADSMGFDIEIPLSPFTLDGEIVETAIYLDGVELPTSDLTMLAGQSFHFPVNPKQGYIDGSMYVLHAHQPIDVTSIRFGALADGAIEAEFEMLCGFEFEGLNDYKNTLLILSTRLSVISRRRPGE